MRGYFHNKINNINERNLTVIPPDFSIICKADTGATRTYLTEEDEKIISKKEKLFNGPIVKLQDETPLQEKIKGLLPLHPSLTNEAKTGHVIKGLTNASLIFIVQLCDDGCVAVFDWKNLNI